MNSHLKFDKIINRDTRDTHTCGSLDYKYQKDYGKTILTTKPEVPKWTQSRATQEY